MARAHAHARTHAYAHTHTYTHTHTHTHTLDRLVCWRPVGGLLEACWKPTSLFWSVDGFLEPFGDLNNLLEVFFGGIVEAF